MTAREGHISPTEKSFFQRVHRQTASLTPELIASILTAFRAIAAALNEAELTRLIAAGAFDRIVTDVLSDDLLTRAFRPVQTRIRRTVERGLDYAARDLPKAGKVDGTLAIGFDILDPNVLEAIRDLDAKILPTLKSDVRESIRQAVQAGLEAGQNPRTIARGIRDIVGLSPSQELAVRNYRTELETGKLGAATSRELHDARFSVKNLTPEKIDRMVTTYRKNMVAFHAETISRTATLDAFRKGQELSWRQAIAQGIVPPDRLRKTWLTVGDDRVRDEHRAMQGETVPFDSAYSNNEVIPGESTYSCRCISKVFVARAA